MSAFGMGLRTGVLVGLVVLLVSVITKRKHKNEQDHYDERQVAVRGMGYRYAFWTLAVELLLYGASFPDDGQYIVAPIVAIYAMVMIAGLVMMAYDVMHDAYFSLSQRRNVLMPAWIAIAASNLAISLSRISEDELWAQGRISERVGLPLVVGAFFAVFFVILGIKAVMDRKEQGE